MNIRYVKILIDEGSNYNNGIITISELKAFKNGDTKNYALNKTATASSYFVGSYNSIPSKAVDGNEDYSYCWATNNSTGLTNLNGSQWLKIDLLSILPIDTLSLSTITGGGWGALISYRVLISTDDISYTTVKTFTKLEATNRTDVFSININRYLLSQGNTIYSYDTSLISVGSLPTGLTEDLFKTKGLISLDSAVKAIPDSSFKVYMWTADTAKISATTRQIAVPGAKLILAKESIDLSSIDCINQVTVTGPNVKIIVSVDSGLTWETWDGLSWIAITPDVSSVSTSGMSIATVNAIIKQNWANLIGNSKTICFGYLLSINTSTDITNIDNTALNVNMKGRWSMTIPGTDYRYDYNASNSLSVSIYASGDYKINY